MADFTPGPLNTLEIGTHTGTGSHIYIVDATGRKIGVCWGKAEEKTANATLWSAAPDLLAAAELLDSVETRLDGGEAESGDWQLAMTALRDAIALVRGK